MGFGVELGALKPGTRLAGRYEVVEQIGSGGYAKVFEAKHLITRQLVAVKTLAHGRESEPDAVSRFMKEARATATLSHPNTVRLYDFGEDLDLGLLFLVMERLKGSTLRDELKRRKGEGRAFSQFEAVNIALAVVRSLSEAHAVGLIHRDLKPGNVFLHRVEGENEPTVKVLDFGLVKQKDGVQTNLPGGFILGTPAYMSPEQILNHELDERCDLYSLGAMMYALLVGQAPFVDPNPVKLLTKQVSAPVPDVFENALGPISRSLADLVTRCLQKSPADRPESAPFLRVWLEQLRDESQQSSPATTVDRSSYDAILSELSSDITVSLRMDSPEDEEASTIETPLVPRTPSLRPKRS